jgi:thiol-disulfide isomerase/thioredoxin
MKPLTTVAALLVLLAVFVPAAFGQQTRQYRGTLDRKLAAHTPPWYLLSRVSPATDAERARVKLALAADDRVSIVSNVMTLVKGPDLTAAFVERTNGERVVVLDLDQDGSWTEQERRPLGPCRDPVDSGGAVEAIFDVPLPEGYFFASYPVAIMVRQMEGRVMLAQSSGVAAQGMVDIAGQKTLVRYSGVNLRTGSVDPASRDVEVDGNGDGVIDTAWESPEVCRAKGMSPVFRVGRRYVSTTKVDLATGTVVMRDHPASDYERIELTVGERVPDFAFVDFDGKPRKLSDFRGKFLLLDFWGTWCGPCVAEFPNLKQAYETYHEKGFEILGMDNEQWEGDAVGPVIERARALVAEKRATWPQARADSIKPTIERFHIVPYPTYVLLDRDGRIVSWEAVGQPPLRGPDLMTTLEKVLGKGR